MSTDRRQRTEVRRGTPKGKPTGQARDERREMKDEKEKGSWSFAGSGLEVSFAGMENYFVLPLSVIASKHKGSDP